MVLHAQRLITVQVFRVQMVVRVVNSLEVIRVLVLLGGVVCNVRRILTSVHQYPVVMAELVSMQPIHTLAYAYPDLVVYFVRLTSTSVRQTRVETVARVSTEQMVIPVHV